MGDVGNFVNLLSQRNGGRGYIMKLCQIFAYNSCLVMGDVGNFVNLSFQRHFIPSEFPPSYDCFLNTHVGKLGDVHQASGYASGYVQGDVGAERAQSHNFV